MTDPRMATLLDAVNPIFDAKRMAHGGFRELVGSGAVTSTPPGTRGES